MNTKKTMLTLAATAALATIGLARAADKAAAAEANAAPRKPKQILEELAVVAGKAGAMKRELLKHAPDANRRYEEIKKMQERIQRLSDEINDILTRQSQEYKDIIAHKRELQAEYQAAME